MLFFSEEVNFKVPLVSRLGSVAQSLAALGATGRQDLAAVAGGHALAEAMLLLSVELLGLIGTLHVLYILSFLLLITSRNPAGVVGNESYATCVLYKILGIVSTGNRRMEA